MSETTTLAEKVEAVIAEHLAAKGGGFVNGFVAIADTVDAEGGTTLYVAAPNRQRLHASIGLARYLDLWFADEAERAWCVVDIIQEDSDDEGD